MLTHTYYAQNYAGIVYLPLDKTSPSIPLIPVQVNGTTKMYVLDHNRKDGGNM
jgi:hypothetical protein